MRLLTTTIFCPNCGTANRDDADICSECGSVIPKFTEEQFGSKQNTSDFGISLDESTSQESYPPPPPPPSAPAPVENFGISVAYDTPSSYQPSTKKVCEGCGQLLRPDDKQCPSCGRPLDIQTSTPAYPPPQQSPSYPTSHASPSNTSSQNKPLSTTQESKIAKCAKCGAIVYDYETRCSNCNRILSAPRKKPKEEPASKTPPGTARCARCNAIVYPHQSICPNCSKPLSPAKAVTAEPYQRVSRCRRCGNLVYPTDSVCSNCGRKLDPV